MQDKLLHTHKYYIGDGLYIVSKFYDNGDSTYNLPIGVYLTQEMILTANCNQVKFQLYSASLTPKTLRELADQLEEAEKEAFKIAGKV